VLTISTVVKVTNLIRGFQVQDVLDRIQRKARTVETFAGIVQDGLAVKNHLTTQVIEKVTTKTQVEVEEIHGDVSSIRQVVHGLDDKCAKLDSNIVGLRSLISEQINDALASKNGMFQMLKDVVSGIRAHPFLWKIGVLKLNSFCMQGAEAAACEETHLGRLYAGHISPAAHCFT
jgi:hypothetical protein